MVKENESSEKIVCVNVEDKVEFLSKFLFV